MSASFDVIQVNLSDHQTTMGQPGSSNLQRGPAVLAVGGASEAFRLRLGGSKDLTPRGTMLETIQKVQL
jgi:hypothetical protein